MARTLVTYGDADACAAWDPHGASCMQFANKTLQDHTTAQTGTVAGRSAVHNPRGTIQHALMCNSPQRIGCQSAKRSKSGFCAGDGRSQLPRLGMFRRPCGRCSLPLGAPVTPRSSGSAWRWIACGLQATGDLACALGWPAAALMCSWHGYLARRSSSSALPPPKLQRSGPRSDT